MNRPITVLCILLTTCSCRSAHENFKENIGSNIGERIDGPYTEWIPPERFIEARMLDNGNVENKYELFYGGRCTYFVEYEKSTKIIVGWRFEGSETDCSIAL